jgi:hypothetical protein
MASDEATIAAVVYSGPPTVEQVDFRRDPSPASLWAARIPANSPASLCLHLHRNGDFTWPSSRVMWRPNVRIWLSLLVTMVASE